jgi:hypothetical protein
MPCRLDLSVQTVRGGCPPNSRRASGSYHARRDGKWGRVCVRAVIGGSMSASSQTETRALRRSMSVLPPGVEMCMTGRFAPEAAVQKPTSRIAVRLFGSEGKWLLWITSRLSSFKLPSTVIRSGKYNCSHSRPVRHQDAHREPSNLPENIPSLLDSSCPASTFLRRPGR